MEQIDFSSKRKLINKRCSYLFQESAYTIKTKKQIKEWQEDFEKVRAQILNSQDSKKRNYTFERFDLQQQEEITIVYWQREIVAFSSLYNKEGYYPKDISRALNRMWKSPKIRFLTQHYAIPFIMLSMQLKKANSLEKNAVFISLKGKKNWLRMLTNYLKEQDERWIYCEGLYKIAMGEEESCWQNVSYLPLKKGYKLSALHKVIPSSIKNSFKQGINSVKNYSQEDYILKERRTFLHKDGHSVYSLFHNLLFKSGAFWKLAELRVKKYFKRYFIAKLKIKKYFKRYFIAELKIKKYFKRYFMDWFYGRVLIFLFHHSPPMKLYYFSKYQYHKRIKPWLSKKRN